MPPLFAVQQFEYVFAFELTVLADVTASKQKAPPMLAVGVAKSRLLIIVPSYAKVLAISSTQHYTNELVIVRLKEGVTGPFLKDTIDPNEAALTPLN